MRKYTKKKLQEINTSLDELIYVELDKMETEMEVLTNLEVDEETLECLKHCKRAVIDAKCYLVSVKNYIYALMAMKGEK